MLALAAIAAGLDAPVRVVERAAASPAAPDPTRTELEEYFAQLDPRQRR